MCPRSSRSFLILLLLVTNYLRASAQVPSEPAPTISSELSSVEALGSVQLLPLSHLEGVEFVNGSGSQIVLERDGKRYLIDTKSQTIRELIPSALASAQAPTPSG